MFSFRLYMVAQASWPDGAGRSTLLNRTLSRVVGCAPTKHDHDRRHCQGRAGHCGVPTSQPATAAPQYPMWRAAAAASDSAVLALDISWARQLQLARHFLEMENLLT